MNWLNTFTLIKEYLSTQCPTLSIEEDFIQYIWDELRINPEQRSHGWVTFYLSVSDEDIHLQNDIFPDDNDKVLSFGNFLSILQRIKTEN